ncbi:hypothetical protein [Paenibacillus pini]
MGVDWYACSKCNDAYCDAGDYVSCECGESWCSDECAEEDKFQNEEDGFTPIGSEWSQDTSCKYCRKEDFDSETLLEFLLKELKMSRKELIKQYKESE